MDRDHNLIGCRYLAPEPGLLRAREERMRGPSYALDDEKRGIVLAAIRQACMHREWTLIAAHVRMSHVHVVVAADVPPEVVMHDLKAYASRCLSEGETARDKRWARHGSTRYLWKSDDVAGAVHYVVGKQGEPMAVYLNTAP